MFLILISPFFEFFNSLGNSVYVILDNGLKMLTLIMLILIILMYSPFKYSIVQAAQPVLHKTSWKDLLRPYLFVIITVFVVELK